MLYWLADFSSTLSIFNVFRYLTVRTGGAMMTALVFVFLFGPWIIDHLRLKQGKGQPIRTDGPKSHFVKAGTPTMGGLMILLGIVVSTLLWANPRNPYVWIVLGGHARLRPGRVLRRLSEGDAADHHGLRRRIAAVRRGRSSRIVACVALAKPRPPAVRDLAGISRCSRK